MNAFRALLNSPVGPKTTHFWGPICNWGIALAGIADWNRPPEKVSGAMTTALCVYSLLFIRFAWRIQPRNYLLMGCHVFNEGVQLHHVERKVRQIYSDNKRPQQKFHKNMNIQHTNDKPDTLIQPQSMPVQAETMPMHPQTAFPVLEPQLNIIPAMVASVDHSIDSKL